MRLLSRCQMRLQYSERSASIPIYLHTWQVNAGCWQENSVPHHVELSRQWLTTRQPASLRVSRQSKKREQARSPSAFCDLAVVTHNHFTVCCSLRARHQAQPQAEGGKLSSTSSRKEIKESVVICLKSEQLLFQKADDEQR